MKRRRREGVAWAMDEYVYYIAFSRCCKNTTHFNSWSTFQSFPLAVTIIFPMFDLSSSIFNITSLFLNIVIFRRNRHGFYVFARIAIFFECKEMRESWHDENTLVNVTWVSIFDPPTSCIQIEDRNIVYTVIPIECICIDL